MIAMDENIQEFWDKHLSFLGMAYYESPQGSSERSPNFMMFARKHMPHKIGNETPAFTKHKTQKLLMFGDNKRFLSVVKSFFS